MIACKEIELRTPFFNNMSLVFSDLRLCRALSLLFGSGEAALRSHPTLACSMA